MMNCSAHSAQALFCYVVLLLLLLQSRRAAMGVLAGVAALAAGAAPSQAAYGDAANVFGKITNKSGGWCMFVVVFTACLAAEMVALGGLVSVGKVWPRAGRYGQQLLRHLVRAISTRLALCSGIMLPASCCDIFCS